MCRTVGNTSNMSWTEAAFVQLRASPNETFAHDRIVGRGPNYKYKCNDKHKYKQKYRYKYVQIQLSSQNENTKANTKAKNRSKTKSRRPRWVQAWTTSSTIRNAADQILTRNTNEELPKMKSWARRQCRAWPNLHTASRLQAPTELTLHMYPVLLIFTHEPLSPCFSFQNILFTLPILAQSRMVLLEKIVKKILFRLHNFGPCWAICTLWFRKLMWNSEVGRSSYFSTLWMISHCLLYI